MFRITGMILGIALIGMAAYAVLPDPEGTINTTIEGGKDIVDKAKEYLNEHQPAAITEVSPSPVEPDEEVVINSQEFSPPQETIVPVLPVAEVAETVTTEQPEQVFMFWGPFQSEMAAKGFARRVSELTGQDVKVLERGQRKYMAAFVGQEDEVQLAVTLFQQKTGMTVKEDI